MKRIFLLLPLWLCLLQAQQTDHFEFLEAFAWGDRTEALAMLVPDTEEYSYYACLHFQLEGDFEAFDREMARWKARNRNSTNSKMRELIRRRDLTVYATDPATTWNLLRDEAGHNFNHRPRHAQTSRVYPSVVDPRSISEQVFLRRISSNRLIQGFTDEGLRLAMQQKLNDVERRELLGRLKRPDLPGLVPMILQDLQAKDSRGFGQHTVHHLLTRAQLERLGTEMPSLFQNEAYVTERLSRIEPPQGDLKTDHATALSYYQELWSFAEPLGEIHNSLKASILYHVLDHLRHIGQIDEELFRTYLALPRPVGYLPKNLRIRLQREKASWVNFGYQPGRQVILPAIGNEEPLVRDLLLDVLAEDSTPETYATFFEEEWLGRMFAESKLLAGVGEPSDWASYLPAEEYRRILDRVEVNLAPDNPTNPLAGEPVRLAVELKNVDRLLVNVYEINPFNYYRTHRAAVDQAVDLEGMVPTHQSQLTFDVPASQRIRKEIDFPELSDRGVYVVEFIGNGVSSRALLHLGHLESISQPTEHGLVMMVLNEKGETVTDARVWLEGQEFVANDHGLVLIPFSENPGARFVILQDGNFASPDQIQHPGEQYSFTAGIHVDPQSLNRRSRGTLLLRPDLRLHGVSVSPSRLDEVKVTLASTDAKGVRSEIEFEGDFKQATEWVRSFYVPEGLRSVEVQVTATLTRKLDQEEVTLTDQFAMQVNQGRTGDTLRQVLLMPTASGWILEVRGLNGELISGEPLDIDFTHPLFTRSQRVDVTTDENGRIFLGELDDLSRIRVSGHELQLDQTLDEGKAVIPSRLHLLEGEKLSLPYPLESTDQISLLKVGAGDVIFSDHQGQLAVENGELRIAALPAGSYQLHLRDLGWSTRIEVVQGEDRNGFLMGKTLRAQETGNRFPSLAKVDIRKNTLTLQVRNPTLSTRVAVRAARYAGDGLFFPRGQGFPNPSIRNVFPPTAQYVSGRELGDEIRYVLERQYREIFAGTLLERPSYLLNPWELRDTNADEEVLKKDTAFESRKQRINAPAARKERMDMDSRDGNQWRNRQAVGRGTGDRQSLSFDIGFDFLPQGSQWWTNLRPDENGFITLELEDLKEQTQLEIVVLDQSGTSITRHRLKDRMFEPREVRLTSGLDPEQAFSRQKSISVLDPGESVTFEDLATTRYTTLQTLGDLYGVLQTLSGGAGVNEFSFLPTWSTLEEEQKQSLYNEFASHELHLFLSQRDPDFFHKVVRPYLAHKLYKTFVDRWLLEALTDEDLRLDHLQYRNALELALLSRRSPIAETARNALREAWEILPPNPQAEGRRIQVALQAGELDAEESLLRESNLEAAKKMSSRLRGSVGFKRSESFDDATADAFGGGAGGQPLPASAPVPPMEMAASLSLEDSEMIEQELDSLSVLDGSDPFGFGNESARLYRTLPKTKEWAEQNYYQVRAHADLPARIPASAFWVDVAEGVKVSPNVLEANRNLTEVVVALAFCGLPFEADDVEETLEAPALTLRTASPALLISEQILPAERSQEERPLLLSQQFFRPDDLYRYEGNEQIEKFVTGEYIRRTVYGSRVTLTNPTASRRRLNLLSQIPVGAIPVRNGVVTEDKEIALNGYTTQTVEFFFSFPESGSFPIFPAHVSEKEEIVGQADRRTFQVVDAPTEVDKTSWAWISQHAEADEVLAFLETHNLRRLNLEEMAWRLKDRSFFDPVTSLLESRGLLHPTTFSYGVYHKDPDTTRNWLAHHSLAKNVGPAFESPLLTVDPVVEKTFEHLEYAPLVNPRTHEVGSQRVILNTAQRDQYRSYLRHQLYLDEIDAEARALLLYHLQLQDRLPELKQQLALVEPATTEHNMQMAYLEGWLALRELRVEDAQNALSPYLDVQVPRWRQRFAALQATLNSQEIPEGPSPDRQADMNAQAGMQPSLELEEVGGELQFTAYEIPDVTLNLYPMDIELLFSRTPFLAEEGDGFAVIQPAATLTLSVKENGEPQKITLPEAYAKQNVMVEVRARGQQAYLARLANQLRIRKMEAFGQIEVKLEETNRPLPKVYVKVFARDNRGQISFWKDGYTDLGGRFDYLSLNDRKPEEAAHLSILILHPEYGAEILQAEPPVR